jgi:hypothetical protein
MAAAGCALLLVADPNEPGFYPTCPFLAATGRWCPGCGSLRGVRALLQGDIATAAGLNILLVVALPFVLYGWFTWAFPTVRGRRLPTLNPPAWGIWAIALVIALFWVLRNLPWTPFTALAP